MKNDERMHAPPAARWLFAVLGALLFPFMLYAQDTLMNRKSPSVQFHGYIKDMHWVSFTDRKGSLTTGNLVHNRINFRWNLSPEIHLRIEARNRLFYGEQVKMTPGYGSLIDADKGVVDLSYNIVDDTSVVLNTMLDRLLLNWSHKKWEITAGRQRINWGINLVWNPNDIFNTFNYFDFDYEERPGSDAVRIQYYSGGFSSFEVAYKFARTAEEQVGAVMYKTNFRQYDLQGFTGVCFQDVVLGTGWAGNIRNIGFKGEVAYFHPYKQMMDTAGVLSASVSMDRSFRNNYFAMISYLYNSEGKGLFSGVQELTGAVLSAKRLMPFEHSFFGQLSKSFNPLINGSLALIFSPQNSTVILLPSVAISVGENWDLALIGQTFFYDQSNNYKSAGTAIYLRLRWSF